jgi:hypothetical protein
MKTSLVMLMIATITLSGMKAHAQYQEETRIKILPTKDAGVVKLLYALDTDEELQVRFFDASGEVASDIIPAKHYPKGISKRYNISKIAARDLRMEVSSSKLTVTYRLAPGKTKDRYIPYPEKTVYNHTVVASK